MCHRTLIVRMALAALVVLLLDASVQAETVDLKPKFQAGRVSYIESNSEVEAKSSSPMGNFDMTLRLRNGLLEEVKSAAGSVTLALTIDRAGFTLDSTMGPSFYDSDVPDEEQSEQWRQILEPQIGMAMAVALDANHRVTQCTGMEAIVKKIDESARENMFWTYSKAQYTDERYGSRWHNNALSIFPNRSVKPGETWTAPYIEDLAELKEFTFDCTYQLERIVNRGGQRLAEISFVGKAPEDRQYESDGMMPIGNIKLRKATLTGTATIDVDKGMLVKRENHTEIEFAGTMGPGANAPQASTTRSIRMTYVVRSPQERQAEKVKNQQIAAAKSAKSEQAEAERRRRFATAKDVAVATASRPNPIGNPNSWPQWGGPRGDFKSNSVGLADSWPAGGPKRLWRRDLGDGYSTIASDGERLYTMYRPTDETKNKTEERVVALDPQSGSSLWEFTYDAPFVDGMDASFGRGPHATPLVVGDRLFTVGATVKLHCFDKRTGKVMWTRDLIKDFNAPHRMYGYGISPLACRDTIILPIGGENQAVIAFKQSDGAVKWQSQNYGPAQASPCLISVGEVEQLILFAAAEVAGLDPNNGKLYWRVEHPTEWGANISTPVWGQDGILFISSAYGLGSRGIELTMAGGKPYAKELWHNRKMKVHHGNAIRVGNFVYGSSGDFGAVFFAAVDVTSGELAWKDRKIGKASSIYADGKMIILNETGQLFLAKVSPTEAKILSEVQLWDDRAWSAPTLVGKRLFVRNRHEIIALDVGS